MNDPSQPVHPDPVWDDSRITAYLLDELPAAERAAFEEELAARPELAVAVNEARQLIGEVSACFAQEAKPALTTSQRAALQAAAMPAARPARGILWLAASVLFLVGLGSGLLWPVVRQSRLLSLASEGASDQATEELAATAPAPTTEPAAESRAAVAKPAPGPSSPFSVMPPSTPPAPAQAGQAPAGLGGAIGGYAASVGAGEVPEAERPAIVRENAKNLGLMTSGPGGASPLEGFAYQADTGGRQTIVAGDGLEVERLSTLALPSDQGQGPGMAGDRFDPITDNPFRRVDEHPLSTFSIDVDTASYAKVRSFLLQQGKLPRPDAVRIEELINYFAYDYDPPVAGEAAEGESVHPFASDVEVATCPWRPAHRLARIGIKGKEVAREERPAGNFVFLLDVSGSMNHPNKLPLLKQGMQLLLEQLNKQDRIAIVVYAGAAGLVLDSTTADRLDEIAAALERLQAGGSTNGGDGIQLAYQVARDHFIEGGINRVILCTDGDFNVGTTGTDSLVRLVEEEAQGGVFLSVLGFGMGNHNDAMLEQISGKGNGNYAFIDTLDEAHKVLVEQAAGTLVTIAKDVKIQVEFNPLQVAAYRLIGYENRILAKEDFNDDTKDAGEIGAGHTVTALYEIVPAGETADPLAPPVDPLRYQVPAQINEQADSDELLTLKLRYKQLEGSTSTLIEFPAIDAGAEFAAASDDFQFAAAVAGFGMALRRSPYRGDWSLGAVEETAEATVDSDAAPRRQEFLQMVRRAAELTATPLP